MLHLQTDILSTNGLKCSTHFIIEISVVVCHSVSVFMMNPKCQLSYCKPMVVAHL